MQATDGKTSAGKPIVVIDGKPYRVHRLRVRDTPVLKVLKSDRPGYVWVETLEPVGER